MNPIANPQDCTSCGAFDAEDCICERMDRVLDDAPSVGAEGREGDYSAWIQRAVVESNEASDV